MVRPPSGAVPVQGFVHVSEMKEGFVEHPANEGGSYGAAHGEEVIYVPALEVSLHVYLEPVMTISRFATHPCLLRIVCTI
eukprot:g31647.t1